MKALIVTSVASMIWQFNLNNIDILLEKGYEVHIACNFRNGNTCSDTIIEELKNKLKKKKVVMYQVPFARKVSDFSVNQKAYLKVKKLIKDNQYQLIHCQSPIGGVVTRLAVRSIKNFTGKLIYTAHGFHFFSGAPKKNWLIYYPIEKYLAHYTDILITINKEDYQRAKKKFSLKKNGQVLYLPGVGVNVKKIQSVKVDREEKRKELGIDKNSFLLVNAAELSKRKNQKVLLDAVAEIAKIEKISLLLCGTGSMQEELEDYARQLKIKDNIIFAGYRTDLYEIYKISDCFVFPSLQEGLPVALMEAMAAGLPIICSKIRGNVDLIKDKKGGYIVDNSRGKEYAYYIRKLIKTPKLCNNMIKQNQQQVKKNNIVKINNYMKKIYGVYVIEEKK